MAEPRVLVIGAGPTGLGAAWRLNELGHANWKLFEAADHPGGLASSVVDDRGFTWDLGGHVLFSHYRYFDALMATALGDAWVEHVREAWVWMRQRWIPYPFQNNIWRLPDLERAACLDGLVELQRRGATRPANFREWLEGSFGRGLCEVFMLPYNRKVWAYDPSALDVGWMGERVATVDLARVRRNIAERRDDVGWGPNSTFRFPMHGGTGAIWRAVCDRLPRERVHFSRTATAIDLQRRTVGFSDGAVEAYDYLISSMPLDLLLRRVTARPDLQEHARRFVHSSSHIVGVGLRGTPPPSLRTKCWIYFPEDDVPFYRGTVFSNYSPNNVPDIRTHWSLMGEVSESPEKPVDAARVADEVVEGFISCGFIERGQVVSRWHRRLEHGYPTPWLGRDAVLHPIDTVLREAGVFSRGRFGAWKYEVSNQDHSLMQGVEVVNLLLRGTPERTYHGDMSDDER
jgi:protoporphyrinogen oxidase